MFAEMNKYNTVTLLFCHVYVPDKTEWCRAEDMEPEPEDLALQELVPPAPHPPRKIHTL